MGLGAVLVDRARRVAVEATPARVDGTTIHQNVAGPWFKCRLELGPAPEQPAAGTGTVPRRTAPAPRIFYRPLLPDGTPVGVAASDRLEVDSPQLGHAMWRVTDDPEPWRKKRGVLAWQATLQRIVEHAFGEVTPP